jgi:hypothetical protein
VNTIIQITTADNKEYMVGAECVVAITEVTPEVYDVRFNYGMTTRVFQPISVQTLCEPNYMSLGLRSGGIPAGSPDIIKGHLVFTAAQKPNADSLAKAYKELSAAEVKAKQAVLAAFPDAVVIRLRFYEYWGYIKFPEAEAIDLGNEADAVWQNFKKYFLAKYGIDL